MHWPFAWFYKHSQDITLINGKQGSGGAGKRKQKKIQQREVKFQCARTLVHEYKHIAYRAFKYLEMETFIFLHVPSSSRGQR